MRLKLTGILLLGTLGLALADNSPPVARAGATPASFKHTVDLGAVLFFDGRFGKDGRRSCSGCHLPEFGWTDREPVSIGVYGRRARRNSPTLLDAKEAEKSGTLFRDGRAPNLIEFNIHPITDPNELDMTPDKVVERIQAVEGYRPLFRRAFGTSDVTFGRIETALALFMRTLEFKQGRFAKYLSGDRGALTAAEARGYALFSGKLGCTACHAGSRLTDEQFHATGTGRSRETGGSGDEGRFAVTKQDGDLGAFRTPPLLNAAITPPYFHDGSAHTLEDVVAFYETRMPEGTNVDPKRPVLKVTAAERADLLEFLKALDATDGGFVVPVVPAQ